MSQQLQKLEQQRDSLLSEIDSLAEQFEDTRKRVDPDNALPLMDARLMIRDKIQDQGINSLKERFGKYFDYVKFNRAMENVDDKLCEDPEVFRVRGRELWMQRRQQNSAEKSARIKASRDSRER